MNIEEQERAEKFYIASDIDGTHTPRTNMVEINYLDMVKLMHRYAEQQVKNNVVLPDVSERYFVVAYVASNTKGHVTGCIDITTDGQYLNRALTIENIKEKLDLTDIVPINMIEMNKIDFDSWRNDL